jgi:hypothetical protein
MTLSPSSTRTLPRDYLDSTIETSCPSWISARGLYGEFEVGIMQHWAGWAGGLKGGAISFGGLSCTEWTNVVGVY